MADPSQLGFSVSIGISVYIILDVEGSVEPEILVGGPSGWIWALRALRSCDPRKLHQISEKFDKNSIRNSKKKL